MTHVSQSLKEKKIRKESDPLVPSVGREDITMIKGIGASMAIKLRNHGFGTISSLAEATVRKLSGRVEGIGEASAQKFIEQARVIKKSKDLVNFTQKGNESFENPNIEDKEVKKSKLLFNEKSSESELNFPPLDHLSRLTPGSMPVIEDFIGIQEREESDDDLEFEGLEDELSDPKDSRFILEEKDEDEFIPSQNIEINNLENSKEDITKPEIQESIKVKEPEINLSANDPKSTIDILCQKELLESQNSTEMLDPSEIQYFYNNITKNLESLDFFIIKNIPELRTIFTGIDLIGVKLVRVKEYLDFIYIVPVRICPLKGNFILNAKSVNYHPFEEKDNYHFDLKHVASSYLQALMFSEQNIFENFLHEGTLLQLISRYLHIKISLKKTIFRESLFYHSGPLQYKILIEPVLVCQNKVGFTEKLIPFAYHKSTNIHVVEITELSNLLQFLDQKYFLIETYTEKENAFSKYKESSFKFMNHLRLLSLPFIGYGFVLLLFLLFQLHLVISLLVNLGYGILALYGISFSYIYIKYYQEKAFLRNDLSTPYYQKIREYDETTLILINEELSPKLMQQFIYESVGNLKISKTISKVEKENAEVYLEHKVTQRAVKNANLFEPEPPPISHSKNDSSVKDQIKEHYLSFLED
jgi:hypothetical protein